MANTLLWASFAAIAIGILFLIAIIQNSVDESSIIATPSIPRENGIFTSVSSVKIKASAEEVFAAISSFKDFSPGTPFAMYHWKDVTADGVPRVGSTGSCKLTIDGFGSRKSQVRMTLLDRESKRLAVLTTSFPPWLLASERVQEVVPVEGQPAYCEYRTWWTLEGVAAYYLLLNAKEELDESQKNSATYLKYFLERGRM